MRITDTSHGSIKKYWDDNFTDESAAVYMDSYGEGPGSPLRHFIGALINDRESVLDVGCGPGWNWDHFKEFGPKIKDYLGLDYSKRFIRVANQRVALSLNPNRGTFEIGDARDLQEPDASWDVVLLQDCLEHINGYEKPVEEALRVARKRVIVTFWHLKDEDDPHINDDGGDTYGAWYDKREWEKYLDDSGYPWLHDDIHRRQEGTNWDIYVISKGEPDA